MTPMTPKPRSGWKAQLRRPPNLVIFLIFDQPGHPWFGVVCTALFAGITIWLPCGIRRRRTRIEGLIAKLSEQEPTTGESA